MPSPRLMVFLSALVLLLGQGQSTAREHIFRAPLRTRARLPRSARPQPPPGSVLPPSRQIHRVALVRRPGCQEYETVAEEFKGHVLAAVRLLPHDTSQLPHIAPDLVFAVGQSAYDHTHKLTGPLLHVLVFRNAADPANHIGIPGRIEPPRVLAAFRLVRPGIRRIAILCSPDSLDAMRSARQVAGRLGIELQPLFAASPEKAIGVLHRLSASVSGLWLLTDLKILTPQVLQYALGIQFRRRVPLMGATRRQVEQGVLFAVDQEPHALGQQAAQIANRLLAGVPARQIEVPPVRSRLCVNRGAAQTLGLALARLKAAGAELVE